VTRNPDVCKKPLSVQEKSNFVVAGHVGESNAFGNRVFFNMVPKLKSEPSGVGGASHLITQFSQSEQKWIVRGMHIKEALAVVLPRSFDARSLVHDEDDAVAMADLGSVTPLDLGWAHIRALVEYCAPVSTFRPVTFEDIGLPVEVVLRWRRGMLHASFDFWRMQANGDCILSPLERPSAKPAHKATHLDSNGKFKQAVPLKASGSQDPNTTKVIYWMERAWRHADASLCVPIQELQRALTTFNTKFVAAALTKGIPDQQIVGYLEQGTNQKNNYQANYSLLLSNSKSARQNWVWLNKAFLEDLDSGAASGFGVETSPPTWPCVVHSSGAVPKDENSRRGISNLTFKGLKEDVKEPWLISPNDSVALEELPKTDYFRLPRVGHHMLVMELSGHRPNNAAYDFWKCYKQFITQLRFVGQHCRLWTTLLGPCIMVSWTMLFGGTACGNLANRAVQLMVVRMQMLMDLIAPTHPITKRWFQAQKWCVDQQQAGDPEWADFKPYFHGVALSSYLDDMQSTAFPDYELHYVRGVLALSYMMSFLLQAEKCFADGRHEPIKKFIGVLVDGAHDFIQFRLPSDKVIKTNLMLDRALGGRAVTLLHWQQLHGLLNFVATVLTGSGTHLALIVAAVRAAMRGQQVRLIDALLRCLLWWKELIFKWNGRGILLMPTFTTEALEVPETDAARSDCGGGAGGVCGTLFFSFQWTKVEREVLDIMHLEALTCVLWLHFLCYNHPDLVAGRRFNLRNDNMSWVLSLNKGRSSWAAIQFLIDQCHLLSARFSFSLELTYISTHLNIRADAASRNDLPRLFQCYESDFNLLPHQLEQVPESRLSQRQYWSLEMRRLRTLELNMLGRPKPHKSPASSTGSFSAESS